MSLVEQNTLCLTSQAATGLWRKLKAVCPEKKQSIKTRALLLPASCPPARPFPSLQKAFRPTGRSEEPLILYKQTWLTGNTFSYNKQELCSWQEMRLSHWCTCTMNKAQSQIWATQLYQCSDWALCNMHCLADKSGRNIMFLQWCKLSLFI